MSLRSRSKFFGQDVDETSIQEVIEGDVVVDEAVERLEQLGMQLVDAVFAKGKEVDERKMKSAVDDLPSSRRLFAHPDEAVEADVKDVDHCG